MSSNHFFIVACYFPATVALVAFFIYCGYCEGKGKVINPDIMLVPVAILIWPLVVPFSVIWSLFWYLPKRLGKRHCRRQNDTT
jgi:hypothetical protein